MQTSREQGIPMATWESLTRHLKSKYRVVATDELDMLSLRIPLDDGHTQQVAVREMVYKGAEWAEVSAVVAEVSQVDPRHCLERTARLPGAGLAFSDDLVILRRSLPLAGMDEADFDPPMHVVVELGHRLAEELMAHAAVEPAAEPAPPPRPGRHTSWG